VLCSAALVFLVSLDVLGQGEKTETKHKKQKRQSKALPHFKRAEVEFTDLEQTADRRTAAAHYHCCGRAAVKRPVGRCCVQWAQERS
jgi:hypothetical protein